MWHYNIPPCDISIRSNVFIHLHCAISATATILYDRQLVPSNSLFHGSAMQIDFLGRCNHRCLLASRGSRFRPVALPEEFSRQRCNRGNLTTWTILCNNFRISELRSDDCTLYDPIAQTIFHNFYNFPADRTIKIFLRLLKFTHESLSCYERVIAKNLSTLVTCDSRTAKFY